MNELPTAEKPSSPALWNPNAAAMWSLLFSPAFGAFIHARNAEALGRSDEAKANKNWFFSSLVFVVITSFIGIVPALSDVPLGAVGVAYLLLWYFFLAQKQAKYVNETFGRNYQKKSWAKPLLIAFGILFAFLLLVFMTAFLLGLLVGV